MYLGDLNNWVEDNRLDLRGLKWNLSINPVTNTLLNEEIPSIINTYPTAELHFYANCYTTIDSWPASWTWVGDGQPPQFSDLTENKLYTTIKLHYNPATNQTVAQCSYQIEDNDIHDFLSLLKESENNVKSVLGTDPYISTLSDLSEDDSVGLASKLSTDFYLSPRSGVRIWSS